MASVEIEIQLLSYVNAPDLVLFVGEALVSNEAIDQLVKINADHSSDNPHTVDWIVLVQFETPPPPPSGQIPFFFFDELPKVVFLICGIHFWSVPFY